MLSIHDLHAKIFVWGEVSLIGTMILSSCLSLLNHNQCPGNCASDSGYYFRGSLGYAYTLCGQICPEIPESPKMNHLVFSCHSISVTKLALSGVLIRV